MPASHSSRWKMKIRWSVMASAGFTWHLTHAWALAERAAKHEAARLRHVDGARRAEAAVRDGYGVRKPPPLPPERKHGDVVIVLDVTGSTVVVLGELKRRIRTVWKTVLSVRP